MKRQFDLVKFLVCVVVASCLPEEAAAQISPLQGQPNGFTWGELALLPEYCRDTQGTVYSLHGSGGDSPRAAEWVALMGEDFWHMHHYCYGLREILRSGQAGKTPQQIRAHRERALNEYAYILRNARQSMVLMPEVYLRTGEAQLLLGNVAAAQEAFAVSRRLRPDYWPAYTKWIEVLLQAKQRELALQLAQEGVAAAPNSPELKQVLRDLQAGGNRTTPRAKLALRHPASAPSEKSER